MASTDANNKVLREFADRVRKIRETDAQITQETLAEQSGLHRTTVSSIERGKTNASLINVLKVAHGLGVDPAEIVQGMLPPAPVMPVKRAGSPRSPKMATPRQPRKKASASGSQ